MEQSSAFAEDWHAVENTSLCVDYDSEKYDANGVAWTYKTCGSDYLSQTKVDCAHQSAGLVWYVYDDSRGWIAHSSMTNTPEYEMVGEECDTWASLHHN